MTVAADIAPPVEVAPPAPGWRRWARTVRWWYGALVLAGAAGWLGYAILRRATTGRWHWSILLDAVPPLLLFLVPLLLLAAAAVACGPRRTWASAIGAAAVLLSLDQTGVNWYALRPAEPVPAGALHVIAWNTQYWSQWAGGNLAFLKRQNADVYLLQEHVIWVAGQAEDGYYKLDDLDLLRREFPGYHIAVRGELLTMSRYPIVAQPPVGPGRQLAGHPDTPFGRVFARDKVLRTDLLIGGRIVSFYNVHITVQTAMDTAFMFRRDLDYDAYYRRKFAWRQEEVRGLEDDVAANPYPMVVAGDFNSTSAMGNMDRLRSLTRDATYANRDLLPRSWKFDSPAGFDQDTVLARPLPFWRVDWTFTRGPVRVHRYDLADSERLSDHLVQDLWISVG